MREPWTRPAAVLCNEESYSNAEIFSWAFQTLGRGPLVGSPTFGAVIGTNNIDHCARTCHAPTVAGLARAFGSGAMTNSFAEFAEAGLFFVIGSNMTEAHPVAATWVKQAVRNGAHGGDEFFGNAFTPTPRDLVDEGRLKQRRYAYMTLEAHGSGADHVDVHSSVSSQAVSVATASGSSRKGTCPRPAISARSMKSMKR
mgnify:CR=1 FL=1